MKSTINQLLIYLFNKKLETHIPIKSNKVARKIFNNRKLKYSEKGFFYVSPMPSTKELDYYYTYSYWKSRGNSNLNQILNKRDLIHFNILKKYIPEYLTEQNVFLNFGSGHGGISHLIWTLGLKIVNIEPSNTPSYYKNRWETFNQIESVCSKSVNIIYGSHSLEHIQDIEKFQLEINRVLKPNGILFWEVPNAEYPYNGAMINKIDIPHTYYFKKQFFKNWLTNIILCESFDKDSYDKIEDFISHKNEAGRVIIAMGQL